MEAVIGVEVSTDTPDPKIMRQQGERKLQERQKAKEREGN